MAQTSPLESRSPILPKFDSEMLRQRGAIPSRFGRPVFALWDLTYRCTLNCIQCFNNSGHSAIKETSVEEALEVARQLVSAGLLSVCLSGGDALLHPAYFEAARILRTGGVSPNTITNGWLVTDEAADQIAAHFDGVEVSLDGATPETHDYVRGRRGSFQRAIKAIERLTSRGMKVSIGFTPTLRNMSEFPALVERMSKLHGVERVATGFVIPTGRAYRNPELPTREQQEAFRADVAALRDKYQPFPVNFTDPMAMLKLIDNQLPNPQVEICANGDIMTYPWIPIVFGNVLRDGLLKIWDERVSTCWTNPVVRRYVSNHCPSPYVIQPDEVPWVHSAISYEDLIKEAG